MYTTLIFLQSAVRWLMLASLLYALYRAWRGVTRNNTFTKTDNLARLSTVAFAYILLLLGMLLYVNSPSVKRFIVSPGTGGANAEPLFFGVIHIAIMVAAIITITIGSARTAYKPTSADKHKSMLVWYSVALLLIIIAIPWPFSPLAQRPYIQSF